METEGYSLPEKMRGRKLLTFYSVFNAFSFLLLSGNIITLFALRMEASSSFIGLISSFTYISFFFMVVGRRLVAFFGLTKMYGIAWLLRYLFMAPILISPLMYHAGNRPFALGLIFFSTLSFHIFRGIGVVAYTPILRDLSAGKDRGSFLSKFQIIAHSVSIITGIGVAFLLGDKAPLSRYLFFLVGGICMGIVAAMLLFRLPEPSGGNIGIPEKFMLTVSRAYKRKNFRLFTWVVAVVSLVVGMVRPFSVVFIKQVYALSDSTAVFYTVIGSFGAIFMGFMAKLLLDRLGAKPLYVLFNILTLLSVIPLILALPLSGINLILFLGGSFFFLYLGTAGAENTAQNYLFGLVRSEDQLNLGIFYYLVMGAAGTLGSVLAGFVLDIFTAVGLDTGAGGFRFLFSLTFFVLCVALIFMVRLERLGAYSFKGALSVLFSLRDLKAISLLQRLEKTTSLGEERRMIKELALSNSQVPQDDILKRLDSPSYGTRSEALLALEVLPLDTAAANSVIHHVTLHPFTTAYIAARIIGAKGIRKGIPVLRESLESPDYLLAAKSMVSLAQLGDTESISVIEKITRESRNPLLLIHGANSLAVFGEEQSIPVLLAVLKQEPSYPYLRDEIILSLAHLFRFAEWFYPSYSAFLEKKENGISLLTEYISGPHPQGKTGKTGKRKKRPPEQKLDEMKTVINSMLERDNAYRERLARLFRELPARQVLGVPQEMFSYMALDKELMRFERFAFLLCAAAAFCYVKGSAPA